jgi:hypothetical protein
MDISTPLTVLTILDAFETGLCNSDAQVFGKSSVRVLESDLDVVVTIGPFYRPSRPTKRSTEHLSEDIRRETTATSEGILRRAVGRPKLIEILALLGIGQHLVRTLDLLELLRVTALVGMVFTGKFVVSLFNLTVRSSLGNSQNFIGVRHLILVTN